MDSKNFTIGILSTTAVILLVGLLIVQTQPAQGNSMNAQGGDYLLITGQLQRNEEVLYVIDAASQKMIVYRYDLNRKTIMPSDTANLSKLAGPKKEAKPDQRDRRGRRGRR